MDYKNPLKMINPLTGMEMTMQPPVPANQMGVAKPVFSPQTQGMAQTVYGTPEQRQISMGQQAPVFMMDIPEGNEGAGLRALDDSVVEQMGYDAATKMVSPVEFHEGVSHKYSLNAENYADSVRVAKREQRFNEIMKPKMTRTITNMPYTEEQLKARNESIKKSEAQELPRIKRK